MKTLPLSSGRNDYLLLAFLISFLVPLTLFAFRYLDNNRLTSWNWALAGVEASGMFFILIIGLIAAYVLSYLSVHERHPILFLVVFSFAAVIPFWSEPEVIIDSSRYFTQAKHLKEYGIEYFIREWGGEINAWTDLPLLPFIYGMILKFFGEHRMPIQIFTSVMFSISVVSTYLIGKILWDKETGLYAGLLLLGIPYLLTQVPLMLVDVATMSFLILAVYVFIMAIIKGGILVLISSITIFLAFFSKYSTWAMLSVIVIAYFVLLILGKGTSAMISASRKKYFFRGISVASLTLMFIAAAVWLNLDVMREQIDILITFQKPALKRWGESYVSTFFYQIHPFITASAIYSIYLAVRKKDLKYVVICWLIFLMIYLGGKRIRYLLPAFPMLSLMASYGLQGLKDVRLRRFLSFSVVSTSLVIGIVVYLPYFQKMSSNNLMLAGQFLNSIETESAEIITLPSRSFVVNPAVSVPVLDIFTEKKIMFKYLPPDPPEKIKMSPLRFTWEYRNPDYYEIKNSEDKNKKRPLVIISSEAEESIPAHINEITQLYKNRTDFKKSSGFFRYSPSVIIFEP